MTTDNNRDADLRRQAEQFARENGFGEHHNRRPGVDRAEREAKNRKRRRRFRQARRSWL